MSDLYELHDSDLPGYSQARREVDYLILSGILRLAYRSVDGKAPAAELGRTAWASTTEGVQNGN